MTSTIGSGGRRLLRGGRVLVVASALAVSLAAVFACGDDETSGSNNGFVANNGGNNGGNNGNNGDNGDNGNNGNNGEAEPVGPFDSFDERPCPDSSVLTYDNFGGPFVLNWCAGCHSVALEADVRAGATVGVDFDTVEDIRTHAERMWARSADQNMTMPPTGGPPAADRVLLGEWLACGAPE